jgi:lysophospholipase L1-like esterase
MYQISVILVLMVSLLSCKGKVKMINAGILGNSTSDLLARINTDVLSMHPDVVILMVGTNDMLNSKKFISYADYEHNLKQITQQLKDKKIKIVMMAPPPVDTVYLLERHRRENFSELANVKLDSVRNIVKRISAEAKAYFVDLYELFNANGIPKHNEDEFIRNVKNSGARDGVHPTEKGYTLISETVFNLLQNKDLIKEGSTIVCFGDSMTKGQYVKGEGTAEGDTYPAQLLRLINDYLK